MTPPLYVAGTRTFAAEVLGWAEDVGLEVAGLLEPFDRARAGMVIHGYQVWWLEDAPPAAPRSALLGTGEVDRRPLVGRLRAAGFEVASLVHPGAHVARSSEVGAGAILGPGVVVGAESSVGDYALVNRGALVGHHTCLAAFVTLGPGANVAGNVRVEEAAFVAMAASVRDHVTIGTGAVVAMGAAVVADVPPGVEVRGVPATRRGKG